MDPVVAEFFSEEELEQIHKKIEARKKREEENFKIWRYYQKLEYEEAQRKNLKLLAWSLFPLAFRIGLRIFHGI